VAWRTGQKAVRGFGAVVVCAIAGLLLVAPPAFSAGTWSTTGSRAVPTATLLLNGKVLVAGGIDMGLNALASAELYDPATGTWSATGSLKTPREFDTATLLPSGKVLIVGGTDSKGNPLASAELLTPRPAPGRRPGR